MNQTKHDCPAPVGLGYTATLALRVGADSAQGRDTTVGVSPVAGALVRRELPHASWVKRDPLDSRVLVREV